jgi:hypothetical protein
MAEPETSILNGWLQTLVALAASAAGSVAAWFAADTRRQMREIELRIKDTAADDLQHVQRDQARLWEAYQQILHTVTEFRVAMTDRLGHLATAEDLKAMEGRLRTDMQPRVACGGFRPIPPHSPHSAD